MSIRYDTNNYAKSVETSYVSYIITVSPLIIMAQKEPLEILRLSRKYLVVSDSLKAQTDLLFYALLSTQLLNLASKFSLPFL